MRVLTFLLLFSCTFLVAQDRPLTYFSQVSYGRPSYTEVGKGIINAGDINGDSIADIAMAAHSTFQIGYGRLENGQLYFDMQAIDFLENAFFNGQLVDVDSDGDDDFIMIRNNGSSPPITYTSYVFHNKQDTIRLTPTPLPLVYPQAVSSEFGSFNEDNITDAYYRLGDEYVIMDGATGDIYKPFSTSLSIFTTGAAAHIDLNGDGMLDFLMQVNSSPNIDTIVHETYINQGDFVFSKYDTRKLLTADNYGDFDGDGILDIIGEIGGSNSINYGIKTNLMSADSADYYELSIDAQSYTPSMLPYDVNNDGYDDVVVFTEDTVYFCKNNQDKTFDIFNFPQSNPSSLHYTSHPSWPHGTVIGQYRSAVPVLHHFVFDGTHFTAEKSSATISPPVLREPPYYHRITTMDADMDGQAELAISSDFELVTAEFENDTFREYTAHQFEIGYIQFISAAASADFNKDGILDVAFTVPNDPGLLQVRYGRADSTFSSPTTLAVNFNLCFKIGIGDFDNNGFIDIAASGGLSDNERFSLFLNQNGSQFIEKQVLDARHEAWNIIDPNADGIPDLAISNTATKIYMNDGQGNLDSTQVLSGKVIKSNDAHSPFIFTTAGNLIKIDSTGMGHELIGNINTAFGNRTSYMLDYDLDGFPDLLFSKTDIQNNRYDTAYLVLTDTKDPWEVRAFPNRYIQGVEDIDGDGTEDVLWQIGPQLWVELINTPTWSAIVEQQSKPLQIFPNPVTDILHFGSSDWSFAGDTYSIQVYSAAGQLVFSNKQPKNSIDVGGLERGTYFLLLKNSAGETFGGAFIKL